MPVFPLWLTLFIGSVTASAAVVLPALVAEGDLSAQVATWIGSIIAAVAGTHHGTAATVAYKARHTEPPKAA